MLKKILDFEKKALTDKIHMGISVGLAVERNYIYPKKPVKIIYADVHRKVI